MADWKPPTGYHCVTPYLIVEDPPALIRFLENAFDARLEERYDGPDGKVAHAEVRIGDSVVMLGGAREKTSTFPGMLHIYCPDADAWHRRAVEAGATSLCAPADRFYGDRSGGVKDAWGNQWWVSTRQETLPPEEIVKRMNAPRKG
jgi:uncharacterized glyoxalase superfamily protein PhnB